MDIYKNLKKDKIIYERVSHIIDNKTGEILKTSTENLKVAQKEPDFIKLYLNTMATFSGLKNFPTNVLMSFSNYITYANSRREQMEIAFNKRNKEQMADECNISVSMLDKYIKKCVDAGVFFKTDCRGVYKLNPFFLAKGEWNNIKELRAEFDFIDNKWVYIKGVVES